MTTRAIIVHGDEYMRLHEDGAIERTTRDGFHVAPDASKWRVLGAVRCNNFGNVVEAFTLDDIFQDKVGPWRNKNGSQRVFLLDFDHGARRMWRTPAHEVLLVGARRTTVCEASPSSASG